MLVASSTLLLAGSSAGAIHYVQFNKLVPYTCEAHN